MIEAMRHRALTVHALSVALLCGASAARAQAAHDGCARLSIAIARFVPSCPGPAPESTATKPTLNSALEYQILEFPARSAPPAVFFLWSASFRGVHEMYPLERMGLWYGARIGWFTNDEPSNPYGIVPDTLVARQFALRASDSALFSEALDRELSAQPAIRTYWRKLLVRDPSTPLDVVLRTVQRDAPSLAVATLSNPRLREDSISFDWWLRFAPVHCEFWNAAILAPSIRDSADRLVAIADVPAARFDGRFQADVTARVNALAPTLAAIAKPASDALALYLYRSHTPDPHCAATSDLPLVPTPPYRGNLILALVASPTFRCSRMRAAQDSLARKRTNRNAVLIRAIAEISAGRLAPNPLLGLLDNFQQAGAGNWPVTDAVSTLDERFAPERVAATRWLASDSLTPDSLLALLFRTLRVRANWRLAQALEENARVMRDSTYLLELAALDPVAYRQVPQIGGWALARMRGKPPPLRVPPPLPPHSMSRPQRDVDLHPPPPPPPPRRRQWPGHCLERDAWSDKLATANGEAPALVADDSVCTRLSAALDSVFIIPITADSIYAFTSGAHYLAALAPPRAGMDVTVVKFDSTFAEISRRKVHIP